jgi:hypothetical protein
MSQNFKQPGLAIDALGSELVCPALNNKPTAGDPVVLGAVMSGVAEVTAALATDTIPVRTAGVYNLAVLGKTNGAVNSAVARGDKLFIAIATAIISKDTTGIPFGIALGAVVGGATTAIDVWLGTKG